MQRSDFAYDLPPELIAQHPPAQRGGSRLLFLDGASGRISDQMFDDLPKLLRAGDLVVFNDTRVIPARLLGHKATGGQVEVLLERIVGDHSVLAQVRASKSPKPGSWLRLGDVEAQVTGRQGEFFLLEFSRGESALAIFERSGKMPLPPYIEREPESDDRERYQTFFARVAGAVAAPTAGLHFTAELFDRLREQHVDTGFITLHVGAGTFSPMRVERLDEHRMHSERIEVGSDLVRKIHEARQRGGRVVAVGTTVVRALETAAKSATIAPFSGETDIFIYPGYRFNVVDGLVTNFHLPESTLLMLVCAFGGTEQVLAAYRHAVLERYRFFSYGDAMLLWPASSARGAR